MKPFSEGEEDATRSFWDWYVIGGRYAGSKLNYDRSKTEEFISWLKDEGVTVSGIQCGKQTLQPASQTAKVDAKWAEMFPESGMLICPLFSHYQDQYENNLHPPDVMRLGGVSKDLQAFAVIVAAETWGGDGLKAEFMIHQEMWNGVTHVETKWDGLVSSALQTHKDRIRNYKSDWVAKNMPTDEWLCVTVDYHS